MELVELATKLPHTTTEPKTITRDQIDSIEFPDSDVLGSTLEKKIRRFLLEQACSLGNLYKHKVHIYFFDKNGTLYHLHTTIWAVTERMVIFKEGRWIPIRAIRTVLLV